MKTCTTPGCNAPCEGNTDLCATHNRLMRKAGDKAFKAIQDHQKKKEYEMPKVSAPMARILREYKPKHDKFLAANKVCAVFPDQKATTIHHKKGKVGYADDWAREHDIPLWLDERFWLAVSMDGHTKIENNPEWAKENNFSLNRL